MYGWLPRRAAVAALLLSLVSTAQAEPTTVTLPGEAVYPESVTATADGTRFVSSFASGGVLRIAPGAAGGEIWIEPGAFGTRSTFGVLADEASSTLWVCSNDLSALGIKGPSEVPGSTLKGFDLKTGTVKASVTLPGKAPLCNDIALGPDGAAYITDTRAPQILRLKPGSQTLEVWLTDPLFETDPPSPGLDGIAFGSDGNLYVNTFVDAGLFRIDVRDGVAGKVTRLKTSRPLVLPDGLRPAGGGTFLVAEGGGSLDRVTIDGDTARIETIRDGFAGGLTGVVKVGGIAWVTEGQLASLTDSSRKGEKPRLPFGVHAVPLTGN